VVVDDEQWELAEQAWIQKFTNLTNLTPGGDGVQKWTQELRNKISVATSKVVYQYTFNGDFVKVWKSATQAAFHFNVRSSSISSAANPKSRKKSAVGFQWSLKLVKKMKPYRPKHVSRIKMKFPDKTEIIYNSLREAADAIGINKGTLSYMLQENQHYWHKYVFYYEDK